MKIFLKQPIYEPTSRISGELLVMGEVLVLARGVHEAEIDINGEYAKIKNTNYSVHKSIFDILPDIETKETLP